MPLLWNWVVPESETSRCGISNLANMGRGKKPLHQCQLRVQAWEVFNKNVMMVSKNIFSISSAVGRDIISRYGYY